MEHREKRENVIAGIVGAFLGSLIGAACIILFGQMGYVASVSGVIMAVCALKGYELLGGRLTKTGIVATCILIFIMTWMGNRADWALSAALGLDIGIFEAFRMMDVFLKEGVIESATYQGGLIMLYLFTLVGAVPVIRDSLRNQEQVATFEGGMLISGREGENAENFGRELDVEMPEVCTAAKGWVRPLRISYVVSLSFCFVLASVMVGVASKDAIPLLAASAVLFLGILVFILISIQTLRILQADIWQYIRVDGTLWRININELNMVETYRFTAKRNVPWRHLDVDEQKQAKASILRAIHVLSHEQFLTNRSLRHAVMPLTDLYVEKENAWCWVVSYRTRNGRRKKWTIAKAYPDFTPAPGMEKSNGPVPFRWSLCLLALLFTMVAMGMGLGIAFLINGGMEGEEKPIEVRVPDSFASYSYGGISYRVDSDFFESAEGVFFDEQSEVFYSVAVHSGMDESPALDVQLELISEYRRDETFDRFQFEYAAAGG